MNKLELLVRDSRGDGQCILDDVMTGDPHGRNVSRTVRVMLENVRCCPWVIIDGSLYWMRLQRLAGKALFSKDSIIRWVLIRSGHMDHSMNQLDKIFTEGGS